MLNSKTKIFPLWRRFLFWRDRTFRFDYTRRESSAMKSSSTVVFWNKRLKAVALGFALALSMLTALHWHGTFIHGHPPCDNCRADFPSIYSGAKLIGQSPSALYDHASQLAIQKAIDPRIGDSTLPFTYPPFVAWVLMPLGWLPFSTAFIAITLINAILLAVSLRLLMTSLQLSREQSTWLVLVGLCNFGVQSAILQGQASFILLILLLMFTLTVRGQRRFGAGFSTGLIFFKPQFQPVPLIILLTRRWWLALIVASVTVILLSLCSVALVGFSGIIQYVQLLTGYLTKEQGHGSYPETMQNLRALVQYTVPFYWAPKIWLLLIVPVVAATVLLNVRPGTDPSTNSVQWIGNFSASVLIAPHLNAHDLAVLIIPTAFALKLFGDPVPNWLVLLLVGLGIYPLLPLVVGNHLPPMVPLFLLIIFIWSVRYVRRPIVESN
jgi:Glycosyltransferase family 87